MADIDRFKMLVALGQPGGTRALQNLEAQAAAQREERSLSNDEQIARALAGWARQRSTREFLDRVVIPAIATARQGIYSNINNPAFMQFYLGMQKSAEDLYEQILTWAGQEPQAPPQES